MLVLTEAQKRAGRPCSGVGSLTGGSTRRSSGTGLLQGVSRLLDSTDRFVKVLRGSHGGQHARSGTRGMELRRWTGSPPAASGANPMASRAGSRVQDWGSFLVLSHS